MVNVNTLLARLGVRTPLVDEALAEHEQLGKKYLIALQQYDTANNESFKIVDALVKGMDRAPTKKIDDIVAFIQLKVRELNVRLAVEMAEAQRRAVVQLAAILAVTLTLGAAIMVGLVRSITRPLDDAVNIARRVADGDLPCISRQPAPTKSACCWPP